MSQVEESESKNSAVADQWAERKEALKARFADVSGKDAALDALGVSLIGGGIAVIVVDFVRGHRRPGGYLIGAILGLAGAVLLVMGPMARRNAHISEAEQVVRDQLASLDPVARAKVMKEMAEEQVASVKGHGATAR